LIFGLSVFAEPTFADLSGKVTVDTGWLDVIKDPCEEEMWVKRGSDCGEYTEIDKKPSNWTVIK
jgi:hypothetical protein